MFCEKCGTIEKLIEHHISYNPEKIQFLCSHCHGKLHWDERIESQFLELEKLGVKITPKGKKDEPKSDLEFFNNLMEHAINSRCACSVCHQLREEYVKRLKGEKVKQDEKKR